MSSVSAIAVPNVKVVSVEEVATEIVVFVAAVAVLVAAEDGDTVSKPKPNADTATSAMRLIDVFVDICFLSLEVDPRTFPESAWRRNAFSSDMSDCSLPTRATFCAA